MNQQAFAGGMPTPPFLPLSLPGGVPTPPVLPGAPYAPSHQNHQSNSVGGIKEEHSDNDQVSSISDISNVVFLQSCFLHYLPSPSLPPSFILCNSTSITNVSILIHSKIIILFFCIKK